APIQSEMLRESEAAGSATAVVWRSEGYRFDQPPPGSPTRSPFDEEMERLYPRVIAHFGGYEVRARADPPPASPPPQPPPPGPPRLPGGTNGRPGLLAPAAGSGGRARWFGDGGGAPGGGPAPPAPRRCRGVGGGPASAGSPVRCPRPRRRSGRCIPTRARPH